MESKEKLRRGRRQRRQTENPRQKGTHRDIQSEAEREESRNRDTQKQEGELWTHTQTQREVQLDRHKI